MNANALGERIAEDLLEIGAVMLRPEQPFTWASGLRTPIYCDNRLTLGHPSVRRRIRDGFVSFVRERPDIIAGTATAGIPHAAWLADALDLPMVYVRSKPKGHGTGRLVEGPLKPDSTVLLVEDLVSTGMSSIAAVEGLRAEGARVAHVVAVFTYGLQGSAFVDAGVSLDTLTNFPILLDVAKRTGRITSEAFDSASRWYDDPVAWSRSVAEAGDVGAG